MKFMPVETYKNIKLALADLEELYDEAIKQKIKNNLKQSLIEKIKGLEKVVEEEAPELLSLVNHKIKEYNKTNEAFNFISQSINGMEEEEELEFDNVVSLDKFRNRKLQELK